MTNTASTQWNNAQRKTVAVLVDILDTLNQDPFPLKDGVFQKSTALERFEAKFKKLKELGQLEISGSIRTLADFKAVLDKTSKRPQEYSVVIKKISELLKLIEKNKAVVREGMPTLDAQGVPTFTERAEEPDSEFVKLLSSAQATAIAADACPSPAEVDAARKDILAQLHAAQDKKTELAKHKEVLLQELSTVRSKVEEEIRVAKDKAASAKVELVKLTDSDEFGDAQTKAGQVRNLVAETFNVRTKTHALLSGPQTMEQGSSSDVEAEAKQLLADALIRKAPVAGSKLTLSPTRTIESAAQQFLAMAKAPEDSFRSTVNVEFQSQNPATLLTDRARTHELELSIRDVRAFHQLIEFLTSDETNTVTPNLLRATSRNVAHRDAAESLQALESGKETKIVAERALLEEKITAIDTQDLPVLKIEISSLENQVESLKSCSFHYDKAQGLIGHAELSADNARYEDSIQRLDELTSRLKSSNKGFQFYRDHQQKK